MSAFKQKMAKLGVRAGLLASAAAAVFAVSAVGASSASAVCVTSTLDLQGRGASLQKVAQEQWTGRKADVAGIPHPALEPATGYAKECNEATKATVSYTSTGSGPGLEAFGFTGAAIDKTFAYIGTDDAPTAAQITSAQSGAGGAKALIIPVAQTAIAVVANPPASCNLTWGAGSGISWEELGKIFGGKEIKNWSGLSAASGSCGSEITRVVRAEGSGTTYQFKNYLATLQTGEFGGVGMPCSLTGFNETTKEAEATTEWAKMKAINTGGEPNTTWPKPLNCAGTTPLVAEAGGSKIVKYVNEHPGSIGYAALPDAKSTANNPGGKAQVAYLQDFNEEGPVYGSPEAESGEKSNCGARVYTVPTPGRVGETGLSVDWSKVFGAAPEVGTGLYPLCTLTFAAAWSDYSNVGYGAGTAEVIKDYIRNYVLEAGQSIGKYYQPLPETVSAENNVLGAAKLAANNIAE